MNTPILNDNAKAVSMTSHIPINDGGPAFPLPRDENNFPATHGMTLRDYFAAKAMQSVLQTSWRDLGLKPKDGLSVIKNSAVFAYEIADAMLKARSA